MASISSHQQVHLGESANEDDFGLLHLPEMIIYKIFSYLTYHDISELRPVCQFFNKICQQVLNEGFSQVDSLHASIQKRLKSQLPRRESERRNHPLARHVDILSAIETRLSLLGMTYTRYIDMSLCCFIPGKVLDELFKILNMLQKSDQPPRAHEFLQELRDISSMAMEHFEEKISPALRSKMPAVTLPFHFSDAYSSPECQPGPSSPIISLPGSGRGPPLRSEVYRIDLQLKSVSATVGQFRKELLDRKIASIKQSKKLTNNLRQIKAQRHLIAQQKRKLVKQAKKINDMNKKIYDFEQKFDDIYTKLSKMKGEGNVSASFILPSDDTSCSRDSLKRPALRSDKYARAIKKPKQEEHSE